MLSPLFTLACCGVSSHAYSLGDDVIVIVIASASASAVACAGVFRPLVPLSLVRRSSHRSFDGSMDG